jgi:deoxyribonuclease V
MDFALQHEHPWDVSTEEATRIQEQLAPAVRREPLPREPQTVAGVDVSIRSGFAQAAIAVLRLPGLEVAAEAVHRCDVPFPYVPGLLSFREMPALLPALDKLAASPDLFMLDSQGLAHPRRFGLACHFGVLTGQPALGVAKSRLTGERAGDLSAEKGSRVALLAEDAPAETIGAVVRTRDDTKPVYVSVGHRITLEQAVDVTLRCSPRYKIPEPTRAAHRLSRREEV